MQNWSRFSQQSTDTPPRPAAEYTSVTCHLEWRHRGWQQVKSAAQSQQLLSQRGQQILGKLERLQTDRNARNALWHSRRLWRSDRICNALLDRDVVIVLSEEVAEATVVRRRILYRTKFQKSNGLYSRPDPRILYW